MLDDVAQRIGSRAQTFEDLVTVTVCALAGGTMEEEYRRTIPDYTTGEKGSF